jgi:hypothetical protein
MPRLKNDVPNGTRTEVLSAQECAYCGDLLGPFEVDHVRPLSRGGDNQRGNLACSCVSCNTQKSNHLLHEWRQWRTANGMTWPPVATHPTEPAHYGSGCQMCATAGRNDRRVTPHTLRRHGKTGYVATYQCPKDGTRWNCWFAPVAGWYTGCPCNYCTSGRLEAAA